MMKKLLLFGLLFCFQVSYTSDNEVQTKKEMSIRDRGFCCLCGVGCVVAGASVIAHTLNQFPPVAQTREFSDALMVTVMYSSLIAYGAAGIYLGYKGNGGSANVNINTSKKQN